MPTNPPAAQSTKIPSIPSLNAVPKPQVESTKQQAPITNTPPQEESNSPFTVDQFQGAWAGLYHIFKDEPRLMAVLKEYTPELIDQEHCVLRLANPWQKEAFKQYGKAVMDHMRQTLHNNKLQLTVHVTEQQNTRRAYTSEEKYKVLLEKNEALANLKTALALQLE